MTGLARTGLLGLASAVAHVVALALLFGQGTGPLALAAWLAVQAIAAVLLAAAALPWLPAAWRTPRGAGFALIVAIDLFVPVAGLAMLVACAALAPFLPRLRRPPKFGTLAPLRYTTFRDQEGTAFRSGQVRGRLADETAGVEVRMQALVAVQEAPARTTGGLLRDLLGDPLEDLRLLAYGLLDKKEKAITQRISAERDALKAFEAAGDRAQAAGAHARIAELHWELVYQNLVQGDLLAFTAQEADAHARAALEADPDDLGLWFLLGRLGLARGDLDDASHAFETALARGYPRERVLPYLAELRFRQRRFSDVLMLVGELQRQRNAPVIEPVLRYWKSV